MHVIEKNCTSLFAVPIDMAPKAKAMIFATAVLVVSSLSSPVGLLLYLMLKKMKIVGFSRVRRRSEQQF